MVERKLVTPKHLVQRLISSGLATTETIEPCAEAEIAMLEEPVGLRMPGAYKDFLRAAGKKAGLLFVPDIDIFFPKVLELNGRAVETLRMFEDPPLSLPERAFVFADRYGEQFTFMICDQASDNPPVYRYYQGKGSFQKIADTFWDFIDDELLFLEDSYNRDPKSPYWDYIRNNCKGPLVFE